MVVTKAGTVLVWKTINGHQCPRKPACCLVWCIHCKRCGIIDEECADWLGGLCEYCRWELSGLRVGEHLDVKSWALLVTEGLRASERPYLTSEWHLEMELRERGHPLAKEVW